MSYKFKYIYGPVYSWRMGVSLGIDPLSDRHKICNLDCVYCQLGRTHYFADERKEFVPTQEIVKEIKLLPPMALDYLTFSGRGEPTLAKNLGEMISALREIRPEKIAVITNATLLPQRGVQDDLALCDYVLAKLDAFNQASFEVVDKPLRTIDFEQIVEGLKKFRDIFWGRLALQMMFVEQNKHLASVMAKLAEEIRPDEVQINTPLRPCGVQPLSKNELNEIKKYFTSMKVVSIYEKPQRIIDPLDIKATIQRHGNFKALENKMKMPQLMNN